MAFTDLQLVDADDMNNWSGTTLTSSGAATIGGALTASAGIACADQLVTRPVLKDYAETVVAHGSMGATETFDFEAGNTHTGTLDANLTVTLSNPPATGKLGALTLIWTGDGTIRTVTWPASVKHPSGVAPTMTGTVDKISVYVLVTVDGGTSYLLTTVGQNY